MWTCFLGLCINQYYSNNGSYYKALKKENAELRLEIDKLQSKIDRISENISQRNSEGTHHSGHAASMLDKEKDTSIELISAKYDELVLRI